LIGGAVIFVGGGLLLPNQVTVARQIVIGAPAEEIFPYINGYKRFIEWSPWSDLDPKTIYTYEGPESGVGAKFSWASDDSDVGSGSQVIIEATEYSHVTVELDFGPMGKPLSYWDLKPVEGGTLVTWSFHMQLNGLTDRWFGLLMDCFIGPDYAKGLDRLKELVQRTAGAAAGRV